MRDGQPLRPEPMTDEDIADYESELEPEQQAAARKWRAIAAAARDLGHDHVRVIPTKSGRRWEYRCSCMPVTERPRRTYATRTQAAISARHHLVTVVSEYEGLARSLGVSHPQ